MHYLIFLGDVREPLIPLEQRRPSGWVSLSGSRQDRLARAREELPELIKPYHQLELVELPADDWRRLEKLREAGLSPGEAFTELLRQRHKLEFITARSSSSTPREWVTFTAPEE